MDANGNLRMITEEELRFPDELSYPVHSRSDLPPEKLALFENVDVAGNRKERKTRAKELGVSWHEYQIFRSFK